MATIKIGTFDRKEFKKEYLKSMDQLEEIMNAKELPGLGVSLSPILIPLVLILPMFMGIDGILIAGPVADGIAFVVSVLLIMREMKKMKPEV